MGSDIPSLEDLSPFVKGMPVLCKKLIMAEDGGHKVANTAKHND